jgi:hypothetical protein
MELVNIKKDEFEEFGEVKEITSSSMSTSTSSHTSADQSKIGGAGSAISKPNK